MLNKIYLLIEFDENFDLGNFKLTGRLVYALLKSFKSLLF